MNFFNTKRIIIKKNFKIIVMQGVKKSEKVQKNRIFKDFSSKKSKKR
jgi:hypothetical protein